MTLRSHNEGLCVCVCVFLSVFIRKALRHMPPLSLTPSSTEFPKFFSANILEEVDGFLLRISE